MYICSQKLLSVSLIEYSVIKMEFNGNRCVPCNLMWDIEYSVITSDVIKSFDCIYIVQQYQLALKVVHAAYFCFCSLRDFIQA